ATLLVSAVVLGMHFFGTERAGLLKDDAGEYVEMAESGRFLARLPYTFRVLSPLLAGGWPGGPIAGFTVLTVGSLVLASLALYAYQRVLGLGWPAALAGSILFATSGGAVRLLTTPTYVDAVSYLAEAVAFLALASGWFWPFLIAVVLGTLNRETGLLLIPLYFAVRSTSERPDGVRPDAVAGSAPHPPTVAPRYTATLVVLLPLGALTAAALLKLWSGGLLASGALATLAPDPRAFRQGILPLADLFDLFSTFGALWLLAVRNLPGPTDFQRRALVFGVLVVLQLVIARGDEGRVLSHLFPIVVPLAMLEVQRLLTSSLPRHQALGALLVLACAASMVHARWTLLEPATLRYALVASGVVVAVAITTLAGWIRPIVGAR
ncbi:MAG: hypothetical protein H0V51_25710, partial [Chloroflexi bacterium]|nr:hypothetical protein [Chloroflexota bacterium]